MALLSGYLVGLAMVVFIGPVFFTLLQTTLREGRLAGWMVALGIFISDIVAVAICLPGARFLDDKANEMYISLAGAAILLGFGAMYIIKPNTDTSAVTKSVTGLVAAFSRGFLVNFVNPFVFGVWLAVIANAGQEFGFGTDLYLFLGASLLGILTTDTLKVLLAHRIKNLIEPKRLKQVYRVIGIVLVGFGIRLLVYAL